MLYPQITSIIESIAKENLSKDREDKLNPLIDYILGKSETTEDILLTFVCTHNSRRSQLSQVWASVMAAYFELPNVHCYSGGTETTAVYPVVLETLKDQGLKVKSTLDEINPIYSYSFSELAKPMELFSKPIDHVANPTSGFAAILTCAEADQACPNVTGADIRIPLTYEDPKKYDGTPLQNEKYMERSVQIASEMFYLFSKIK